MEAVQPTHTGIVPWPDDIAARYVAKGYWEDRPLGAHLADAARADPHAVCLVDGDLRLTFGELMARADGAALRLRDLGVTADDRVVLQLPNCWEFVVMLVACLRLGAIPVLTLRVHRRAEISDVVAHAEARAIVVPDVLKGFDHRSMALEVAARAPSLEHVLVAGADVRGGVDVGALCAPADDPEGAARDLDAAAPDARAVALFVLSGGTTGTPKFVARTHNDLAYMMKRAAQLSEVGTDAVYLAVLPLGHGFPITGPGVLGTLIAGGRVVLCASPAPERAFPLMDGEDVTITSVVPAVVQRWLEHRAVDRSTDLGSLRLLQVGGSRLPDEVAARITPALGCMLQQVFGMSEGLLCMTRLSDPIEAICRSQGRPVCPDDEIRIVDESGEPVVPGEQGVLLTRGPYTPWGYYRAEELNRSAFVPGGWYRTGDVVRRRVDGNLVVEGRDKDVINRGGEKITAEKVENFAHALAGVRLAAAVSMPDATLGERVCLYVVVDPGVHVMLDDVRELMLAAGVARFKLPDRLVVVDALPVTAIGKVDKRRLRADIARRLEAEQAGTQWPAA